MLEEAGGNAQELECSLLMFSFANPLRLRGKGNGEIVRIGKTESQRDGSDPVNRLNPAIPPQTAPAEKIKALVLDWAGTTVDFGSVAPARTMQGIFSMRHIDLTEQEARQHMGLPKKDHIREILAIPRIREVWRKDFKAAPEEKDVEALYAEFIPLQFSCLMEYSAVLDGVPAAVEGFRSRGLKIGSTTGYTREMLDMLLESSAKEGYTPDCSVTPGEVGAGRPHPYMIYECAIRLQVYPTAAIAKVGDTPADVREGLNAGAWSIGVAGTGNMVGIARDEFFTLPDSERESLLVRARNELREAGAHYVIDSLSGLSTVLDDIDARLEAAACEAHIHA